ncbi:FG-GAP repeat domain-containing protein [Actinacidiphila acididurans]|uniref:VCBS repeat-containing protein n=1 Tax=Actinacidiphila acididurans TaxID=2784346 RepID=A0ABS2U1L6_9ACTN|nr:VCBS repeat-containing protein [Actinacidiphila acididurans]MBM9508631.1 VCBS repeat-containing protein [Actinacidiphila acididurans]
MFSSISAARTVARRRGRLLLAACTAGALAAGALVLGPAGLAQAAGPSAGAAPHIKTLAVPHTGGHEVLARPAQRRAFTAAAGAAATTTPRYDYDGDGRGDLLTQEIDGTIGVLSSTQQKWVTLGTSTVRYRDILTPGDLTSAYAGDEVLGLTQSGRLSMFTTTGLTDGSALWTGTGWQIYNQVIAVGDTNGDGWGDLLARTPSGDVYLYRGTGSATAPFAARVKVGYGYGIYDQLIGAGDLTGSGHQTLVGRDLNGDLWMYVFNGTAAGPLSGRVKIGYGWQGYNQIVGFGDDADAVGGILGRLPNGDLYYYQGDGTGTGNLTARDLVGHQWNDELLSGQGHTPLWGKNDLFGQTAGGALYFYYGYNTGGLSSRSLVDGDWKGARLLTSVSLSDQDEEPLLELYQGVLYNDTPGFTNVSSSGWGSYNLVFGPGDLSGDGRSDLLARDTSGVLWLLTGKGNGTFYGRSKIGAGWNGYNQITGAGDINGDGYPDIVARNGANGHLYLYLGTGSGSAPFKARVDIGGGWNAYTRLAAPGDLDGDGRADIVAVTSGGLLYRYSGSGRTGTATFKARAQIGTSGWNSYSALF